MRPIYLLYDERMKLHVDKRDDGSNDEIGQVKILEGTKEGNRYDDFTSTTTVENPQRIACIFNRLMKLQNQIMKEQCRADSDDDSLRSPFIRIPCPLATKATIELAHSSTYYEKLSETCSMSPSDLQRLPTIDCTKEKSNLSNVEEEEDDEDMYFCTDTFQAASLACGGVVESVNVVTSGEKSKSKRALALVRPPSHHACAEKAMGFCFFNSVAVAAKHAIETKRAKKVLILDWDIHHGNGTQDLTYDDENIMYISLHRFTNGTKTSDPFFPGTGKPTEVGLADTNAHGMNINIAWEKGGMRDIEYGAAFCEVLLPVIAEFSPDLLLISCGLDAANGDLLGDCSLTPSMYYLMTKSLIMTVGSEIPTVVALEGGYSLDVISECMEAVALALLDMVYCYSDDQGRRPQDSQENELPDSFKDCADLFDNSNECKEDKLEMGKNILSVVWDHGNKSKSIQPSAVKSLNKTIYALSNTPWNKVGIQKLRVVKKFSPSSYNIAGRMTTRSSSQKFKSGEDMNDMNTMMNVLKL